VIYYHALQKTSIPGHVSGWYRHGVGIPFAATFADIPRADKKYMAFCLLLSIMIWRL